MRFWHSIISILLVTLMLVIGLAGMANFFAPVWEVTSNTIEMGRLVLVLSGAAIWGLALFYVITGRKRKRDPRYLSFDNEGGSVSISTDAISDYITKLTPEFPSIVSMKPKVVPARNQLDVVIKLKVKAGSQISEVCELLQQRVRESMAGGLGIEDVRQVRVSVDEIALEHVPG